MSYIDCIGMGETFIGGAYVLSIDYYKAFYLILNIWNIKFCSYVPLPFYRG